MGTWSVLFPGVIPIDKEGKRINWNKIRTEYIGGGTSYRKLSEKYAVSFMVLKTRAKKENWPSLRTQAEHNANTLATQRVAESVADNAAIAADLKRNLLLRLKKIEENYPCDATEVRTRDGKNTLVFRIRDLTAAYKELTEDMQTADDTSSALLQSLMDLERKFNND